MTEATDTIGCTRDGHDWRYCSAMPGPPPSFADLGLRPVVVHALRRAGAETPFPIQAAAIPDALAGRDILGRAPTGSGKTLAFGVPLLHRLAGAGSTPGKPRGLVLAPTRELVVQIEAALEEVSLAYGMRVAAVIGGVPLKRQVERLRRGVDVVVATPGRLEDLAVSGGISLSEVQVTVVDEADRMADLGFLPQVEALLDRTPADGQRSLYSATLDGDVRSLVDRYLRSPVEHRAEGPPQPGSAVRHHFLRVSSRDKDAIATSIAARDGKTIVFLRTKHAVDRFTESLLRDGVLAAALHGDKSQAKRVHALSAFADGSVPVLVATDVVARGIHVDDVSLVLHVDPPADAKDYTHRAGRTARAGASGVVVTLVTDKQEADVAALAAEAHIDVTYLDVGPLDGSRPDPTLVAITGARTPPGSPAITAPATSKSTSGAGTRSDGARRRISRAPVSRDRAGGRSSRGGRR